MRKTILSLTLIFLVTVLFSGAAFSLELPDEVTREDTLIVDQIFRYSVTDNFNMWTEAGPTPTRQGLVMDCLWYIDQQTGEWINSLGSERPEYSDDYTEMVVNLREGIYWSDGEEFTADDVVFTVKTLKDNPGLNWSATIETYVDDIEKLDRYKVKFTLSESNPRFHYFFTVRYNAIYMMPEHVWKDVEDPRSFDFYPVVSLGAYTQVDSDPSGYWELFKRRDDWERTTVGKITGKPGPKYILTAFYGEGMKKIMAMNQHELDLFMNVNTDAFKSLIDQNEYARSWYEDFPWAWPNELACRYIAYNWERDEYDNKDVRWALTLAMDAVEIQTEYIGGVTRVTPIPQPSTPFFMDMYHKELEPWLKELELEVDEGEYFKPYDPTVPEQIGEWARDEGYEVPEESEELKDMFGVGWWKHAPDVAEKLLKKHGFTRNDDGNWLLPNGDKWTIDILVTEDEVDSYRLAMATVDQWRAFGIDAQLDTMERNAFYARENTGDFDVESSWVEDASDATATADKWNYIQAYHTDFYVPEGEPRTDDQNMFRMKSEELDKIIKEMGALHPEDPEVKELTMDFFKLWTENMFYTTVLSFKKFVTIDEYYWENYPSAENPYGQACYWFTGGRFIYPYLEKTDRE